MENDRYRQNLANVDSELHEADIKSLKFLCEPSLRPKKYLSLVSSGLEIFDALEKSKLLSPGNFSYLTELLRIIGRFDLASQINPDFNDFDVDSYAERENCVCPFRTLLFRISEDLSSDEVTKLRYLYQKVPKKDSIDEGIDLFSVMLKHQSVSKEDLSQLRWLLREIERMDLLEEVEKFSSHDGKEWHNDVPVEEFTAVQESFYTSQSSCSENESPTKGPEYTPNICPNEEPMDEVPTPMDHCEKSFQEMSVSDSTEESNTGRLGFSYQTLEEFNVSRRVPADAVDSAAPGVPVPDVPVMASRSLLGDDDYTPMACYKMDAQPRGLCIVIDNYRFTHDSRDSEAVELKAREGSDKDREALRTSFTKLGFTVQIEQNLSDTDIVSWVTNVSQRDHRPYDCFVCCIMSHGGENYIFGSNGRKISISNITSLFRAQSCPSLAGKPKLFFMACCRGKTHQPGVAPGDIATDAPQPEPDLSGWVPNEADFLFGYATVPNHVSYRSKTQGTFYISELTKVLDRYAQREDIQTLLLRVNEAVSSRVYQEKENVFKQVPAPQHTLRKQLKFF